MSLIKKIAIVLHDDLLGPNLAVNNITVAHSSWLIINIYVQIEVRHDRNEAEERKRNAAHDIVLQESATRTDLNLIKAKRNDDLVRHIVRPNTNSGSTALTALRRSGSP